MFIRNTPDLIKNKEIDIYTCGSPNLQNFLKEKKIIHIYRYIHYLNGKTMWVYILCDELKDALKEWSDNAVNKKGGDI